jgi:hemerythrin
MKTSIDHQLEELFAILNAQMQAKSYFSLAVTVNRLSKYYAHFTDEEEDKYSEAVQVLDAQEDSFQYPDDTLNDS